MAFSTTIDVRGFHEDRFGHVNNARYLEFLEEGRWAYLEARGPEGGFPSLGLFPVVVHLTISYRRPSSAGDRVRVTTEVTDVSSRKIVMHQTIDHDVSGARSCEADVSIVLVNAETGRPTLIDERIEAAWPDLVTPRAQRTSDTISS